MVTLSSVIRHAVRTLRLSSRRQHLRVDWQISDSAAELRCDPSVVHQVVVSALELAALRAGEWGHILARVGRNADGLLGLHVRTIREGTSPLATETGLTNEIKAFRQGVEKTGAKLVLGGDLLAPTEITIIFPKEWEVSHEEPSGWTRETVLVVEDDPDTGELFRRILQKRYPVLLAASASQAREELRRHRNEIGAIVLDLSLAGGEDGLSLARSLRRVKRWKGVPIIAATAHTLPEDRSRALEAGCDEFLAKPFDPKMLISRIERYAPRGH